MDVTKSRVNIQLMKIEPSGLTRMQHKNSEFEVPTGKRYRNHESNQDVLQQEKRLRYLVHRCLPYVANPVLKLTHSANVLLGVAPTDIRSRPIVTMDIAFR